MLAYLFWHQPRGEAAVGDYEDAQRSFQAKLEVESACFRLERLPFAADAGYEDWYLVEDWRELGALNENAVDSVRGPSHDRAAELSAHGWGGVYALVRGPAAVPAGADWVDKPWGEPGEEFIAKLAGETLWQRQLVLGPAPEFCVARAPSPERVRIWPEA